MSVNAWTFSSRICLDSNMYQGANFLNLQTLFTTEMLLAILTLNFGEFSGGLIRRYAGLTLTDRWRSSWTSKNIFLITPLTRSGSPLSSRIHNAGLLQVLNWALPVPWSDLLRHRRISPRGRSHPLPLFLAGGKPHWNKSLWLYLSFFKAGCKELFM